MNLYTNIPLTQILHSLKVHPVCWVLAPTDNTFSYEDWIGDPEEAYADDSASRFFTSEALPDIEPEEFESDYRWFLS